MRSVPTLPLHIVKLLLLSLFQKVRDALSCREVEQIEDRDEDLFVALVCVQPGREDGSGEAHVGFPSHSKFGSGIRYAFSPRVTR